MSEKSKDEKKNGEENDKLTEMTKTLQGLTNSMIHIRNSFQQTYKELDGTVSALAQKKKEFRQLKSDIISKHKKSKTPVDPELMKKLDDIENSLNDLNQRLTPATGSLFVRLFLGRVNVKHYREGERMRLKTEYEKFRSRTNYFIILCGILQLVFPRVYLIQAIFQVWLIYYYVTLALREQILRVNGSNINQWWIFHHYLSIILTITILTWRWDTPTYLETFTYMSIFTICQGTVQILLNRYQIGRLYNLVARGEATRMDVTAEVLDPRFVPSLSLLLPCLMALYSFQLFNGYTLLHSYFTMEAVEMQVLVLGFLFVILATGNFWTTIGTYVIKNRTAKTVEKNPINKIQ